MLELYIFSETVYKGWGLREISRVFGEARHTGIIIRDERGQLHIYQVTNRTRSREPLTWEFVEIRNYRCETRSERGDWLYRVGDTNLTIAQAAEIFEDWKKKPENEYYHFGGRANSGWLRRPISRHPEDEPSANCRDATNDNIITLITKGAGHLDPSLNVVAFHADASSLIEQKARRKEFNTGHIESPPKPRFDLIAVLAARKAIKEAKLLESESTSGAQPQAANGGAGAGTPANDHRDHHDTEVPSGMGASGSADDSTAKQAEISESGDGVITGSPKATAAIVFGGEPVVSTLDKGEIIDELRAKL